MLLRHALPLALVLACGPALAQTSQKPIQIIVPFAPGASADGAARIVANELGPRLGRQVVVENKAGAGGTLGLQQVANPRPTATRSASARPARCCSIPICRAIPDPICCASSPPWPS